MTTDRLIIRYIEETDYDDICEYGCDEETGQYMLHWPKTGDQVRYFIKCGMEAVQKDTITWHEFVIELKASGKVIGNISLMLSGPAAEIGWISNRQYWNNGYMTEAVKSVINHAFRNLGIQRIFATCALKNVASRRVMEKCNMKRNREERSFKAVRHGVEVVFDRLIYSIENNINNMGG
jgi:ribosomal-protein-alanine N-acetyltransferase